MLVAQIIDTPNGAIDDEALGLVYVSGGASDKVGYSSGKSIGEPFAW